MGADLTACGRVWWLKAGWTQLEGVAGWALLEPWAQAARKLSGPVGSMCRLQEENVSNACPGKSGYVSNGKLKVGSGCMLTSYQACCLIYR